ncbi:MAG: hypothetical protein IJA94_03155 [Bacilli bacterium]|nr:hypothetical protein [Bacilli bacterium]
MEKYYDMGKEQKYEQAPMMSVGYDMGYMDCCNNSYPGVVCPPVYECPQERVCHRYICHEVPHIQPCNTKIVNHHVYRHTFTPCYSCCEENVISNVYDRKCC